MADQTKKNQKLNVFSLTEKQLLDAIRASYEGIPQDATIWGAAFDDKGDYIAIVIESDEFEAVKPGEQRQKLTLKPR